MLAECQQQVLQHCARMALSSLASQRAEELHTVVSKTSLGFLSSPCRVDRTMMFRTEMLEFERL